MIHLRPAAVQEIKRLLRRQAEPSHQVCLHLQGGGCLEWTYQLRPAGVASKAEVVVNCGELEVVVAKALLPYLQGLTVDFSEDLMGGGFRFINPQAVQTCGCGNSFSLTANAPPDDCESSAAHLSLASPG